MVSLPAGTLLTLDRYYIRQGSEGFDSVTFLMPGHPRTGAFGKKEARFWAKLEDVNEIEFEHLEEDQAWWWGVKARLQEGETVWVKPDFMKGKEVEIHPFTVDERKNLPGEVDVFVVSEGARVSFITWDRGEERSNFPFFEGYFAGRRNNRNHTQYLHLKEIIGYVAVRVERC